MRAAAPCSFVLLLALATGALAQSVTPDNAGVTVAQFTTGNVAEFTVTNESGTSRTWTLACDVGDRVTSCESPPDVTVGAFSSVAVQVTYAVGAWGSGEVGLATSELGELHDRGSYSVTVTSPPQPAIVSTAAQNGDFRSVGACAMACLDFVTGYASPTYVSMDTPRGVALTYNSATARPMGFVQLDATNNSSTPADKLSIRVYRGQVAVSPEVFFVGGPGTKRLAVQFEDPTIPTGSESYTVIVRSHFASTILESSATVRIIIVNERASPFGAGWMVTGLQRLVQQSDGMVAVTDGTGSLALHGPATCQGSLCTYAAAVGDFTRIRRNDAAPDSARWSREFADSSVAYFHADGRLHSVADRFGLRTRFLYDAQNRIITIYDPAGKYTTFGYRAVSQDGWKAGTIHSIGHGGNGPSRSAYFGVNLSDNLTDVGYVNPTAEMGQSISMVAEYDASHRIIHWSDRRWSHWYVTYDHAGKVDTLKMPFITASGQWQQPRVIHRSLEAQLLPNVSAGVGTSTNPAVSADPATLQVSVRDPGGHTTTMALNRFGQPMSITEPLGLVTTITRSASYPTLPTQIRDPREQTTGLIWDGPYLTLASYPDGSWVAYRYGAKGQPDSTWGSGTSARLFLQPATGRVDSVRYAGLDSLTVRYYYGTTAPWRLDSIRDPKGHVTSYRYDATTLNVDSVTTLGNQYTRRAFDGFGRTTSSWSNRTPRSFVLYDELNRVVKSYAGTRMTDTVRIMWDGFLTTRVRDPQGNVHRFEHNALGWVTRRFDPADTVRYVSFAYDVDGLPIQSTNRRNQTVNLTYDVLHRLLSRTGPAMADSFAYNPLGTVVVGWNAVSRDSIYLRANGWTDAVATVIGGQRFRRQYVPDSYGRLDSVALTSTTALQLPHRKYVWNAATHALDEIRVAGHPTRFSYDAEQKSISRRWPNGIVRTIRHTGNHQVDSVIYTTGVPSFDNQMSRSYGYDTLGRIQSVRKNSDPTGHVSYFAYDSLGRLSERREGSSSCSTNADYGAQCSPPLTLLEAFTYDSVGNRRDHNGQYASGNRLTYFEGPVPSGGGYAFESDFDGNVTRKYWSADPGEVDRRYSWTADGKLRQVWIRHRGTPDDSLQFDYNAFGQLVRRSRRLAVDQYYVWDGANLWLELNSAMGRVAEYVHDGLDQPSTMVTTKTDGSLLLRQFEQDQLGRIVAVANFTTLDQRVTYDSWGFPESIIGLSDTSHLLWKGLLWQGDSAQLYYVRNRWYDPTTGRFLSEDPIGIRGGLNLYAFAASNPIDGFDPFGLCPTAIMITNDLGQIVFVCPNGNGFPIAGERITPEYETGGGGFGFGEGSASGSGGRRGRYGGLDEAEVRIEGPSGETISFGQATALAAVKLMRNPSPLCSRFGAALHQRYASGNVTVRFNSDLWGVRGHAGEGGRIGLVVGGSKGHTFYEFVALLAHEESHYLLGPHMDYLWRPTRFYLDDAIYRLGFECARVAR